MKIRPFSLIPLGMALALGGCSGLLVNNGKPDALFRFGAAGQTAPAAAPSVAARAIGIGRISFASEIDGDRILTSRGKQVLYIKDARWAAPAPELFTQALLRTFEDRAPDIRISRSRGIANPQPRLQISIDRFEARYDPAASPKNPPVITIEGTAALFVPQSLSAPASRRFSVSEQAQANSKTAIVEAFDRAAQRYLAEMVDWTVATSALPEAASPENDADASAS